MNGPARVRMYPVVVCSKCQIVVGYFREEEAHLATKSRDLHNLLHLKYAKDADRWNEAAENASKQFEGRKVDKL